MEGELGKVGVEGGLEGGGKGKRSKKWPLLGGT